MGVFTLLHERFHEARADLIVRLLRPDAGWRLLDLGGAGGSLAARIVRRVPMDVTVADISPDNAGEARARGFDHVVVAESRPLPFRDAEFDLVLSNSVIEHATLPKSRCRTAHRVDEVEWKREARSAQSAFAREVQRVGQRWFVQTPHRHFPIDAHTWLPFTHYLTHNNACRLVHWTDRFWVKKCAGIVDWELLTPGEMAHLFPSSDVHVERFLGLPKSIVAYGPRVGSER